MSKPKLILIGAGGHSLSCIDVIEQQAQFQIAGFVGLQEQLDIQHQEYGYSTIATDSDLLSLVRIYQYALIATGQIQSAEQRIHLFKRVKEAGFELPTIISPSAYVSRHAALGAGTIVMHGAIVNAGAIIGNNCIINSCSLIEHHAKVEDHCHISTGAILNGGVSIGVGTFVGSGSIIKQGLSVGRNCVVGMGLSLRHDLEDKVFFKGHGSYE
jgi:sugar O-acyltransferase (sialic acid O-acetyltransferase NeuD family)